MTAFVFLVLPGLSGRLWYSWPLLTTLFTDLARVCWSVTSQLAHQPPLPTRTLLFLSSPLIPFFFTTVSFTTPPWFSQGWASTSSVAQISSMSPTTVASTSAASKRMGLRPWMGGSRRVIRSSRWELASASFTVPCSLDPSSYPWPLPWEDFCLPFCIWKYLDCRILWEGPWLVTFTNPNIKRIIPHLIDKAYSVQNVKLFSQVQKTGNGEG